MILPRYHGTMHSLGGNYIILGGYGKNNNPEFTLEVITKNNTIQSYALNFNYSKSSSILFQDTIYLYGGY